MRIFHTKAVEKMKIHVLCSITFFRKSCRLWDNVEKYYRAGQATDDKVAHAHCTLDTLRYKHTLRICNTYCFSTATIVAQMRLNVTYIACLVNLFVFLFSLFVILSIHFCLPPNKLTDLTKVSSVTLYLRKMKRTVLKYSLMIPLSSYKYLLLYHFP
jgi:hypothetical protein